MASHTQPSIQGPWSEDVDQTAAEHARHEIKAIYECLGGKSILLAFVACVNSP